MDDLRAFKGISLAIVLGALIWTAFFVGLAHAQQPPSPEVRALNARLNDQGNMCQQYATAAFGLQDKLAASEAEVKRLIEKYEPKKDEPPKP